MTVRQYFAAVLRRWYVLVGVLAVTLGGVVALHRDAPLYWGRVDVVFFSPPNAQVQSNVLTSADESVIFFAAAVQRVVDAGHPRPALASPDATLYGTGARHGFSIRLYNSGGQWVSNYERPVLSVQAVGTSQAEAQEMLESVVREVQDVAARQQVASGASSGSMITTEVSPTLVSVTRLNGSWTRAAAALGLLGFVVAAASAVLVDNHLSRRRPADAPRSLSGRTAALEA